MEKAARNALIAIVCAVVLVLLVVGAVTGTGRSAERAWLILAVVMGVGITLAIRLAWRAWRRRAADRAGADADGS